MILFCFDFFFWILLLQQNEKITKVQGESSNSYSISSSFSCYKQLLSPQLHEFEHVIKLSY